MTPARAKLRFAVDPGDVPAAKAARRLHLTPEEFQDALPALLARGFPGPDPTTGMFDLEAIDAWRRARNPHLFALTGESVARKASTVVRQRMGTAPWGE